jgi:hypothetical protein
MAREGAAFAPTYRMLPICVGVIALLSTLSTICCALVGIGIQVVDENRGKWYN